MSISRFTKIVLMVFAMGTMSTQTHAHMQKAAITKILFNDRSGNIEVMHRFYVHDAEHAADFSGVKNADIIGDAETREAFSKYVTDHFAIMDESGNPLTLSYLGNEIDGIFLWVYQEIPIASDVKALTIRHDALRKIWPDQINTVNIEIDKTVKTAVLEGNVELATIKLVE